MSCAITLIAQVSSNRADGRRRVMERSGVHGLMERRGYRWYDTYHGGEWRPERPPALSVKAPSRRHASPEDTDDDFVFLGGDRRRISLPGSLAGISALAAAIVLSGAGVAAAAGVLP